MIRFQPIQTSDVEYYRFMEKLLTEAFPPEEYRPLEDVRQYTDQTNNFYNNIILNDEQPIGFITYWAFERFFYIEHLAMNPVHRNKGYGKQVRSEEHTSELQSRQYLVCRLLLEKKKKNKSKLI